MTKISIVQSFRSINFAYFCKISRTIFTFYVFRTIFRIVSGFVCIRFWQTTGFSLAFFSFSQKWYNLPTCVVAHFDQSQLGALQRDVFGVDRYFLKIRRNPAFWPHPQFQIKINYAKCFLTLWVSFIPCMIYRNIVRYFQPWQWLVFSTDQSTWRP